MTINPHAPADDLCRLLDELFSLGLWLNEHSMKTCGPEKCINTAAMLAEHCADEIRRILDDLEELGIVPDPDY